ncbi:MAG: hypothetical protein JHD04_01310 [Nocardioides sp.]|nr:hypothetical protein [Nocardioides sp.]
MAPHHPGADGGGARGDRGQRRPILGDAPELARQLRGAMARNPDLPADDFTRDKLTTDGAIRRGL